MATYTDSKDRKVIVSSSDLGGILRAHNVTDAERPLVTSVCLGCQSITVAPDLDTKRIVQREFDMTCCDTTILL